MKRIILSIIILIFLTGCSGLFNLGNFVLPDDLEFIALMEELDTPEKICQYMLNNFTYKLCLYTSLTPYQLYTIKEGDCNDYVCFGMFFAHHHGYETYQSIIYFRNDSQKHSIAVYKEEKYSFSDNGDYFTGKYNYNSFLEIVNYDCYLRNKVWTKYIVYDYNMNIIEQNYNN